MLSLLSPCIHLFLFLLAWGGDCDQSVSAESGTNFSLTEMLMPQLHENGIQWKLLLPVLVKFLSICCSSTSIELNVLPGTDPPMRWGEGRSEQEPKAGPFSPACCVHTCISVRIQNTALGGFQLPSHVRAISLCPGSVGADAMPWWLC